MSLSKPQPLLSEFSDDPYMVDLVEEYVSNLHLRVDSLSQALEVAEIEELGFLAHQIKGSAGGYGFMPISDQASILESLTEHDSSMEEIRQATDDLVELCRRAAVK